MIWIDDISELQYYNQPADMPCYCDELFTPNDILLQAKVPLVGSNNYNIAIYVYSADGLTNLGEVTGDFEWYAFLGTDGQHYINIRGIAFSSTMCNNKCFILRVKIWGDMTISGLYIFDKYTERYCLDSCCTPTHPNSIIITNA